MKKANYVRLIFVRVAASAFTLQAQAQQLTKIPRIGFVVAALSFHSLAPTRGVSKQDCATLVMPRERTS